MDNKDYNVVGLDGKEYANISLDTIKDWYNNKLLNENSLIFSTEAGQWQKLKNVFNLAEFKVGQNAPPQGLQYQPNFNQPPFKDPNQTYNSQFQPNQNFYPPAKKSSPVLKIILGVVSVLVVGFFGLAGIGAFVAKNIKQSVQAKGNEKALAELKKYEIPGSEFVDQKSGAKVLLPKDWRMISLDNPIIYIVRSKEDNEDLKKFNLSENAMLATDKSANKTLLLEVINFPNGIDRSKFFDQSAKLVETEIMNQSKLGTYKQIASFSTVLGNGMAKKIIFEKVSNLSNPNAKDFGEFDSNKVLKGQMIVMANENNAFVFQMWTDKDVYDAAVNDFTFIEEHFSMPKDIIK